MTKKPKPLTIQAKFEYVIKRNPAARKFLKHYLDLSYFAATDPEGYYRSSGPFERQLFTKAKKRGAR